VYVNHNNLLAYGQQNRPRGSDHSDLTALNFHRHVIIFCERCKIRT